MYLLSFLTTLLPPALRPYAKAVYPAIVTLVGVAVSWIDTGVFDGAEVRSTVAGGIYALLVYVIENRDPADVQGVGPVR